MRAALLLWTAAALAQTPGPGFGLLGSYSVDGLLFARPRYVPAVSGKNLLIVATLANSVYAFDADRPGSAPIWHTSLGPVRTSYSGCCGGETFIYSQGIGIVSTPAVDAAAGRIYVVSTNPTPTWVLSVLSLTTGAMLASTPITGQFPGAGDAGDTVTGGMLQFNPAQELQRPGLALSQGKVYVAFGGVGDNRPWHGWLFAYNTADLSQAGVFCTTPSSFGGAIWQSGGAPAIDAAGNVYVTTGNDNSNPDSTEYGESVLKLSPTLALLNSFTPSNYATLDSLDADLSSNGVIVLPGGNVVAAGKDFNVYLLDSSLNLLQTFKSDPAGVAADMTGSYGMAFANGRLYLPTTAGKLFGFQLSGSTFTTTPFATQAFTAGYPGPAQLAVANGTVWATTGTTSSFTATAPGTLHALDALTLTEIWNSGGTLGTLAKFNAPTIANGRVYVATQDGRVQVFGMIPSAVISGLTTIKGRVTVQ